ncbi:Uncharacterised protein [Porphyromonas macacae]|uniref:Uncharacterized protein n=1 Tax=Porphyromonas macacae TaxID=28115 RepID=A0A379DKF3_9PORP|nr:Uncharacterised protein [Porphyromonas macacae]
MQTLHLKKTKFAHSGIKNNSRYIPVFKSNIVYNISKALSGEITAESITVLSH